jgi:hypothetical protein
MTKMNKFNMTFCTKSTKIMKNKGANDVPQLLPGSHPGGVLLQSYITMFQFSPVEITKRNKND